MINMDICETKLEALKEKVDGNVERAKQLLSMPASELRTEYVMDCWQRNCDIEMDIRCFQHWLGTASDRQTAFLIAGVQHPIEQLHGVVKKSQWLLLDVLVDSPLP